MYRNHDAILDEVRIRPLRGGNANLPRLAVDPPVKGRGGREAFPAALVDGNDGPALQETLKDDVVGRGPDQRVQDLGVRTHDIDPGPLRRNQALKATELAAEAVQHHIHHCFTPAPPQPNTDKTKKQNKTRQNMKKKADRGENPPFWGDKKLRVCMCMCVCVELTVSEEDTQHITPYRALVQKPMPLRFPRAEAACSAHDTGTQHPAHGPTPHEPSDAIHGIVLPALEADRRAHPARPRHPVQLLRFLEAFPERPFGEAILPGVDRGFADVVVLVDTHGADDEVDVRVVRERYGVVVHVDRRR